MSLLIAFTSVLNELDEKKMRCLRFFNWSKILGHPSKNFHVKMIRFNLVSSITCRSRLLIFSVHSRLVTPIWFFIWRSLSRRRWSSSRFRSRARRFSNSNSYFRWAFLLLLKRIKMIFERRNVFFFRYSLLYFLLLKRRFCVLIRTIYYWELSHLDICYWNLRINV